MKKILFCLFSLFVISCSNDQGPIISLNCLTTSTTGPCVDVPEDVILITEFDFINSKSSEFIINQSTLSVMSNLTPNTGVGYTRIKNIRPLAKYMFSTNVAESLGLNPNMIYLARIDKCELEFNFSKGTSLLLADSPDCGSIPNGDNNVDWLKRGYVLEINSTKYILSTCVIYIEYAGSERLKQYAPVAPAKLKWNYFLMN